MSAQEVPVDDAGLEAWAQPDFWGHVKDPFVGMLDRFGVYPMTVWDIDYSDAEVRKLKALLNDGASREGSFKSLEEAARNKVYSLSVSVFNPDVAARLINCYGPEEGGLVYDPFGGGGTRAIMCAKRGLDYVGVELRGDQCELVRQQAAANGVGENVVILQGDSTKPVQIASGVADFCLTCPPYYNLETYNGGDDDLSMLGTYGDFLNRLNDCISQTRRILKTGSYSVWVVGIFREPQKPSVTGGREFVLRPLHHDVTTLHLKNGFELQEEIILAKRNNGAIQRVCMFNGPNRPMVRIHEYAMVYRAITQEAPGQMAIFE